MALITVIIPMYNKGELIVRAIGSIQRQAFQDFEIIVVDDGSTDNGAEIVKGINDNRIKLIQQENAGPGAARNAGINAAESEYIAFLDADDEWYPWFLENSIKAIREHNVPLVSSFFYKLPYNVDMSTYAAQNGIVAGKYCLTGNEKPTLANALVACFNPINTCGTKNIFQKHGGYYDKERCILGEDQYLFLKIVFSEPVAVISPPAVIYHVEDSQLANENKCDTVQPYLTTPEDILSDCPVQKRDLMQSVLDLRAINKACHLLEHGRSKQAGELISKFPTACQHKSRYQSLMRKFGIGPIFPVYSKVKKTIKNLKLNNKIRPSIPPMPNE